MMTSIPGEMVTMTMQDEQNFADSICADPTFADQTFTDPILPIRLNKKNQPVDRFILLYFVHLNFQNFGKKNANIFARLKIKLGTILNKVK
jgi:hypothetical protein